MKDQVLDQIWGEQGSAAIVERLEDELRVVRLIEVDGDDKESLLDDLRQELQARSNLRGITLDAGPFSNALAKERVRGCDA